jgi:hypothetical protein
VKIEDLQTAELAYIRRGWCQTWRVLFEMQNHHSYRAGFSSCAFSVLFSMDFAFLS